MNRSVWTKPFLVALPLFLVCITFVNTGSEVTVPPDNRPIPTEDLSVVEVQISSPEEMGRLIAQRLTVIDARESWARVLATPFDLERLREEGFGCEIVFEDMAARWGWKDDPASLRDFHTYSQMTDELQQIASTYPDIAELHNLGNSIQGRAIWGLKITDNPGTEEDEPEVRICGLHHGDELMSAEVPLLLCWHLVENYGSDPAITNLVDEREIWVIPMVNPDGREASPYPTRGNANRVDVNRDYGYMWGHEGGSTAPFSQPETQAMRRNALDNNFVLSLSFHCSGDIVNFVWNCTPNDAPDYDLVLDLSERYGSHNGYWVVEGYDWYQVRGDTNDFSYGCRGDIDWTIEIQNNNVTQAWDLNRDAILEIIEAAGGSGIRGTVTDALTGDPLSAVVWVEEAYWPNYTDPVVGDYHKLLDPGTYTVHYRANGYEEQVHTVVVPSGNDPALLDVGLNPLDSHWAYQVTWCDFNDPYNYPNNFQNNPTAGPYALGPPDNYWASLGVGGEIVIDMGIYGQISNGAGPDLTVYEGDISTEGYEVYVSNTWNANWTYLGDGMGTTSFDLDDAGLETARYVHIVDDGDGSPTQQFPGFDLDAVESLHPPLTTLHVDNHHSEFLVLSGQWPTIAHPNAYLGDTRVSRPGIGNGKAAWRVDGIVVPGTYDVYAWKIDHENLNLMATDAHYKVRHRTGFSDWILVDLSVPGNEWVHLGQFEFDQRSAQGVLITDEANGYVTADAIRLDRVIP